MLLLIFTPFPIYSPGADIVGTVFSINDMTTSLGTLANLRDQQFQDQLSEPGAGSITFQNDDPDLALINPPFTVIRFDIMGWPAWTLLCEEFDAQTVAQGEDADEVTVWSGRGHLALLERGVVYPSRGVNQQPIQEDRTFTWTSAEYDDSLWINATQITTVAAAKVSWGLPNGSSIDPDYPDNTAYMLWATSGSTLNAPPGVCYFRKDITIPADGFYLIYWLSDNAGSLYIDGLVVDTADGFWNMSTVLIELTAGDHTFAAQVENFVQVFFNPGAFLFSIYTTQSGGLPLALLDNSTSAWKILEYPPFEPGMTPGQAMRLCVDEWQARGGLAGITLNFDDVNDSAGEPWPIADMSTKVGTDILTFFRELAASYVDMWMDPTSLDLFAWNYGTRGTLQSVTYEPPTDPEDPNSGNITALAHKGAIMIANKLLVRWRGGWSEVADPISIGSYGDIEATLGLGAMQTFDAMVAVADVQLGIYANPREELTLGIEPIAAPDTPYVSYQVGDTVTVEEPNAFPTDERVVAMTVTTDPNTGRALFSPTVKDVLLSVMERDSQAIKKMSNGTLRGSAQVATPVNNVPNPKTTAAGRTRKLPFITVADNGSGDFTSIKDAIDSVPINTLTVIYVKCEVQAGYSDTGGTINVNNKQVIISGALGPGGDPGLMQPSQSSGTPSWTLVGFNVTDATTSIPNVILAGIRISQSGSTALATAAVNTAIYMNLSEVSAQWGNGGWLAGAGTIRYVVKDSFVRGQITASSVTRTTPDDIHVQNSVLINTFTGARTWDISARVEFADNSIDNSNATIGDTQTFSGDTVFSDNVWASIIGNVLDITWNPTTGRKAFDFTGNTGGQANTTNPLGALIVGYSGTQSVSVNISGNTMRSLDVTLNGPGTSSRQNAYISGSYRTLTIADSNVRADVQLNLNTFTGLTALTVTGDQNLVSAALDGGTGATSTTYNVSGDDNVFMLSGEGSFTAGGTDSGTGNLRMDTVAL